MQEGVGRGHPHWAGEVPEQGGLWSFSRSGPWGEGGTRAGPPGQGQLSYWSRTRRVRRTQSALGLTWVAQPASPRGNVEGQSELIYLNMLYGGGDVHIEITSFGHKALLTAHLHQAAHHTLLTVFHFLCGNSP